MAFRAFKAQKTSKYTTVTNNESPDPITLHVTDRSEMESTLNATVQRLMVRARHSQHGILVTRSGPYTFTVSLTHEVPFGLTREHQDW
jgi:hypothetical protein